MAATTLIDRALLRLSGEDVRGFLQGLLTSDIAPLAPHRPLWTGLLTPQGKALFDFLLWADQQASEDVLIDCEREAAEDLVRRLSIYRLRRFIDVAPEPNLAVHWSLQGDGPADPRLAALGHRWLAPSNGSSAENWRRHRLELGVTEGRGELGSDKALWLECNARELNGVSFTKGCFVGQENTARMHHRARVNRRLLVIRTRQPGERARAFYPEFGLAVEHRRIDDLGGAIVPEWLAGAL
ncbi:MAG: CAF17-like 4Fe-4S cluster assembly/insertion protein YgfZ [Sphingosinicella sp.]